MRYSETDRAIRDATRSLLSEMGYARLTVEGVAARSGVAKTTIYRRFPSKAELVFSVMVHPADLGAAPDTGSFQEDLAKVMGLIVEDISAATVGEALLGILVDMAREPALADAVRERFVGSERSWISEIVGRAAGRGEVAPDTDADLLLDLMIGSILSRVFVTGGAVDRRLEERVIDVIVEGLAAHRSTVRRHA
jgi:AcrR family transcriptional regulator